MMMMAAAAAQASTDPTQDDVDEDIAVDRADARLLDHRMRSMNMIPAGNSLDNSAPFVLQTNHLDYIHDLVFDTYGRRMASCSGDRFVKIWDMRGVVAAAASTMAATSTVGGAHEGQQQQQSQQQQSQQVVRDAWVCSAAWQAHRGSVTCLSWCHPEYGTLLATSGLDQEVKIWEERSTAGLLAGGTNNGVGVPSPAAAVGANNNSNGNSTSSLWTLRASLTEAKRAVTCVAFAPRHCGLKVASASCDGSVRIYEAIDVVNVGSWPLSATLQAYGSNEKDEDDDEDDGGGNRQRGHRHGNAAADPRASSSSASSASSYSPSSHWLTLSWCTGRFDPPTLVVGGGTHPTESAISMAAATTTTTGADKSSSLSSAGTVNAILIYRYMDTARAWLPMRILPRSVAPPLTSNGAVLASSPALCVAWAPNVGRRYHYVAAAFGDGLVVYKLKRGGIGMGGTAGAAAAATTTPTSGGSTAAHTTADLEFESAQVLPVASAWRCQWNVTGTVLACSGDSGSVHMYKVSPHSGKFDLVSEIRHSNSNNNKLADGNESSNGQD
jgi:nucleoporin SEH1